MGIPRIELDLLVENEVDLKRNVQRFGGQRKYRSGRVQATEVEEVSVTPPCRSESDDNNDEPDESKIGEHEIIYYIIVIKSKKGTLEILIREYDGYVIALRPQPTNKSQNHGWFIYSDVNLPVHLFGSKNWKMSYDSRYSGQQDVMFGMGALDKLVLVGVAFTEANCKNRSEQREEMLQLLNVFAGETPRLSFVLRFFVMNICTLPWIALGDLSFWTNHWANLGDGIIHIVLALLTNKLVAEGKLKKELAKAEVQDHMQLAKVALQEFKKYPLSQDSFIAGIPKCFLDLMPRVIVERPVFGANESREEFSLPLLMSYILLIKYERDLVPLLILRRKGFVDDLKGLQSIQANVKDEEKKSLSGKQVTEGCSKDDAKDEEKKRPSGKEACSEDDAKDEEKKTLSGKEAAYGLNEDDVKDEEKKMLSGKEVAERRMKDGANEKKSLSGKEDVEGGAAKGVPRRERKPRGSR